MKIEYENGSFIELNLVDYLFFVGGQNKWKRKIIRSLKRFSLSKNLSDLEEEIYGENGIEVYYGGKLLKGKNTNLMFLEDDKSIYNQLSFTKDNLMYQEIQELQHKVEITRQMERINDELIILETILNNYISQFSNSISSNLGSMLFTDILKNNLKFSYFTEKRHYPLEMLNPGELLDEYLKLLRTMINRKEEIVWLVIINPESFLEMQDFQYLYDGLKQISTDTKQLKFFIFSNHKLNLNYTMEDIGKTVLLYENYEQMLEYEFFEQSIERHYPKEFKMTPSELVASFYRISHLIGKDIGSDYYISSKDVVLLKVINNLLQIKVNIETSVDSLSLLEKAFLND
ncbi:CRISPR-associated protein Csn2-St [Vagococcus sp.]|uniref:CRISPR-associated protein Csn2-St n=1 Tax=Vagococcus sp. TaxID=1933889 RepID=UPI003F96B3BD